MSLIVAAGVTWTEPAGLGADEELEELPAQPPTDNAMAAAASVLPVSVTAANIHPRRATAWLWAVKDPSPDQK